MRTVRVRNKSLARAADEYIPMTPGKQTGREHKKKGKRYVSES